MLINESGFGEYTKASRASMVITEQVRLRMSKLDTTLADTLMLVAPKRKIRNKVPGWTSMFFMGDRFKYGVLGFDPVQEYTPAEMRRYMVETKMVQMRLPVELHKWFKKFSQKNDTTMTSLVVRHIMALQAKHKRTIEVDQI